MKNSIKYLFIASAAIGVSNASFLALHENFNSYTLGSLNGQGGWAATGVQAVSSTTFDSSPAAATIGGSGSAVDSEISKTGISVPMKGIPAFPNAPMTASFDVRFTEDTLAPIGFNVIFSTTGGLTLGAFEFLPSTTAGFMDGSFSSSYLAAPITGFAIETGVTTDFEISTWWDGSVTKMNLKSVGVPLIVAPITITDPVADVVTGFSATLYNFEEPSSISSVTFDNINVIPEPSSVLLLGLSALGFIRRKR